jgi:tRNA (Thr-GGU) A37 N-methylase
VLKLHPRDNPENPLRGVFATRSSNRPNPVGLHPVEVQQIDIQGRLKVYPLEALDRTPVIDIKPILRRSFDR